MLAKTTATLVNRLDVDPGDQMLWWTNALNRQCRGALDDLMFLAPWLSLSPPEKPSDKISGLDKCSKIQKVVRFPRRLFI